MSNPEREAAALATLDNRQKALNVLRDQLAPNASDQEIAYLGQVGQRLGLDPIAGHVVLIERQDSRLGRKVHRPTVTAEGRLVLAERTGELEGFDGPEWCGPRNATGGHDWVDVWDGDTYPHAARVIVYRRGRRPTNGTVRWSEFAQTGSGGALTATWAKMPSHMLGKTAMSLGLRRAFPGIIPTDLVLDDDLADLELPPAERPRVADGDAATLGRWYGGLPAPTRHRVDNAAEQAGITGGRLETDADRDRLAWLILSNIPERRRPVPSAEAWTQPAEPEPDVETDNEPRYDPDDAGRPFTDG